MLRLLLCAGGMCRKRPQQLEPIRFRITTRRFHTHCRPVIVHIVRFICSKIGLLPVTTPHILESCDRPLIEFVQSPPFTFPHPRAHPGDNCFVAKDALTPIIAFLLENHPWVGRGMIGCGRPGPKARPRGNNFLAKHVVIENQCISLEIPYIFENVL